MLRGAMPEGTLMFGCKEFHKDGVPHYHAVLGFPKEVYWEDALSRFRLRMQCGEVDTRSIRIRVPYRAQAVEQFLRCTVRYCAKNENELVFGERFGMEEIRAAMQGKDVKVSCGSCGEVSRSELHYVCRRCLENHVDVMQVSFLWLRRGRLVTKEGRCERYVWKLQF